VVAISLIVTVPLAAAACSIAIPGARSASSPSSRPAAPSTISTPATTSTTSPPLDQPGWTPVSYGVLGIAVDQRSVVNVDGSQIVVARFHAGQVRFALHVGSEDPPVGQASVGPDAGSSVNAIERSFLLAAFNGGFKIASGSGGFEVDGQVLSPLIPGRASFVIDTDGSGHVGVWGQTLPVPGERVLSVRQNLVPLITDGQLSPQIAAVSAWGSTIGNASSVARSALGEDAQGNILYAAGMSALPVDLGTALLTVGAVTAMQLDINPEWIQLALAPGAGAPLVAGVPGQNRPADQYLVGWTRDFITVLAVA
jgi:hypothetical protein